MRCIAPNTLISRNKRKKRFTDSDTQYFPEVWADGKTEEKDEEMKVVEDPEFKPFEGPDQTKTLFKDKHTELEITVTKVRQTLTT